MPTIVATTIPAVTVAALVLLPGAAAAQAPAAPAPAERQVTLTLEQSLRAALSRAPEVRQAEAEVESVLGKRLQARGAGYPQLELTTVLGPSPRARGDQIASTDEQYSPEITGVFIRGGLELVQPIFTWGLIRNAREAAEHGLRATRAGVDVKSTEVALKVKEAYWGLVAARQIRQFLLDVKDQVAGAVDRTKRLIESGYATDVDVYRLVVGQAEIEKGLNQVDKNIALARGALAAWTGQPTGTVVEAADAALPSELRDLRAVEAFVEDARARRPEWTQLSEGIQARRHLVEVERKKRYPLFFVGIFGSAAYATNRDHLDNPFVIDPLNHLAVGPVIGFKYNLDFGIAAGKIKEAEAELHKLEALQQYAGDGIPLQVLQAYRAVVEARRNVEYLDEAHRTARQWLVVASSNVDLGIGESRDLADAFLGYAKTRADYLLSLYAYVYGLEQLAHAAGLDVEEVHRLSPPEREGAR